MDRTVGVADKINRLVKELEWKGVRFFLTAGRTTELVFSLEKGYPSNPTVYIGREVTLEKLAEHLETIKQRLGDECYV